MATEFDPGRLTLARQLAGLTKRDLASRLELSPAAITQFEGRRSTPRPAVVARMSLVLGYPPEYFMRTERRRSPRPGSRSFFRSLRSTRQWERDRAEALAEHVADIVDLVSEDFELPELQLPDCVWIDSSASRGEIERAAAIVRDEWRLPAGPVGHVVRELEAHGILVCRLGGDNSRLDAFSRWLDDRPLVVLWAAKADKVRSRFDASHELGHLAMHPDPEPANPLMERQAHAFAAAFLMPADQIEQELPRRPPRGSDWDELFATRRKWGVSVVALFKRAHDLGALSEASFRRAMIRLSERGMRVDEGDDLGPPEQPGLLRHALLVLAEGRRRNWEEIADHLHFGGKHLSELVDPSQAPAEGKVTPQKRSLRAV